MTLTYLQAFYSINAMAEPCTCHSFCQNLFSTNGDKLAGTVSRTAPTNNSGTPISTLVVSNIFTPTLAIAFAVALFLDHKLFKQFIKAYLEAQVLVQIASEIDAEPCK